MITYAEYPDIHQALKRGRMSSDIVQAINRIRSRRVEELLSRLKPGDTLLVSELSRLGRSLSEVVLLVENLIKKKVKLVAIKQNLTVNGTPDRATKMAVAMFSIMAEMERDMISLRTKNGLAAAKARGVKLGNPNLKADNAARSAKAQKFAESLRPILTGLKSQGLSQRAMMKQLNDSGVKTSRGGQWSLSQLQRVLKRLSIN